MRKWIIIVAIVLVIAIVLRFVFSRRTSANIETTKVAVEVLAAARGNVQRTCELLGSVNADKTAQVFPETIGRVTQILAKEGQYVAKNDPIMAIRNETIGFEYEEGYIKAPISGEIAKIQVNVGSMITPQMPVAIIVDYTRVKVSFNLPEADINCISKDKKVSIQIDALPNDPFSAQISEISPIIDPMTRTLEVKAVVSNTKKLLKPGMTARVKIIVDEKNNALAIPAEALLDSYVFVVKDSTVERRDVVAGLIGDNNIEIVQGLAEGERIVVVGQERLAGGETVTPVLRSE